MTEVGGDTAEREVAAWAASGAMALTGRADGPPLGPPRPLVSGLRGIAAVFERRAAQLGGAVEVDPLALLAERAAIGGLTRGGRVSCGGATRLLPTADGWVAVSLARDDDLELVPAWLGVAAAGDAEDSWEAVAGAVARRPNHELVAQATLLGLPVSALPRQIPPSPRRAERIADHPPTTSLEGVVVVDLGALWAGPLCGALLADAGATVVKLESTARPDGARRGPAAFFDLLNAGKRSVALDLGETSSRRLLGRLLARADVVIETSRPRALAHLGIDARALLAGATPRVWVSITGHGRTGPGRDRVGFGDDAAVGGGLVVWEGGEPRFCADAVADPCTGLAAAAAALAALADGGSWLLDISLAGVAASLAGPTLPVPDGVAAAAPAARRHRGTARPLGADTAEVLGSP